ncbi:MAG: hypothetical protein C5B59_00015 [Bacteroidetes bacterium]|nr:MAG: hypothetical protein C5B59_00015 [Bacteroidota bacterium]
MLIKRPSLGTCRAIFTQYGRWKTHLPDFATSPLKLPWICFGAIDYIQARIKPDMHIFEYGSGYSTLFWKDHAAKVISIEHDDTWYDRMNKELSGREGVAYVLALPEKDTNSGKDFRDPDDYVSKDDRYAGKNFENYVKTIDKFPDSSFDIIVVDGRARPSCIKHAIPKLKKGAYLIVDNTERRYYLAPFSFKKPDWEMKRFPGPVPTSYNFSETTILKKLI